VLAPPKKEESQKTTAAKRNIPFFTNKITAKILPTIIISHESVCEFSTRNSHDFLYKRMQNSGTKSTMMADNCNRRTTNLVLAFACHQRLAEWPRTKALDGRP
jgi:hypothetical protein